jgi:chorismate mutase
MVAALPDDGSLDQLRAELEGIDRSILLLLGQLLQTARRAVAGRRRRGGDATDRTQESVVLERASTLATAFGVPEELARGLYRGLMAEAKRPAPAESQAGLVTVFVEAPCRRVAPAARLTVQSRAHRTGPPTLAAR